MCAECDGTTACRLITIVTGLAVGGGDEAVLRAAIVTVEPHVAFVAVARQLVALLPRRLSKGPVRGHTRPRSWPEPLPCRAQGVLPHVREPMRLMAVLLAQGPGARGHHATVRGPRR